MVKFSWVFCFVWICPCGSISIGKARSDNFIEVGAWAGLVLLRNC